MVARRRGPAIEVEGADELRRALKEAGDSSKDLNKANKAAGEVVVVEARTIVPVLSGALSRSIKASAGKTKASVKAGGGLAYGAVIHFGWPAHGIEPQPFLYDALDARRAEVVKVYEERMAEIVARI
jgi:hypothetical protein